MTATNHTEHYELSQYMEGDRPMYTGDYNGDMSEIDAAIYAAFQSAASADPNQTLKVVGLPKSVWTQVDEYIESKLAAAATPSTTGLTTKESDMQYSDEYNIVRVGTPTCSTETEDSSHE